MAACLVWDGKELDLGLHQQGDSSDLPTLADLDIPGFTWLYLSVPDAANPTRTRPLIIKKSVGKARPSGKRSEHRNQARQSRGQERSRDSTSLAVHKRREENLQKFPYPLPRLLLTNARSLREKIEDLRGRLRSDTEMQSCEFMCFTETWLTEPPYVDVQGYREHHSVRNIPGKTRGGGLAVLVKNGVSVQVADVRQTENYQFLEFNYKSENFPEDTPPVIFILAYIQPQAKQKVTKEELEKHYNDAVADCDKANGGPVFILGDFNWYDDFSEDTTVQYVTCPTRKLKILDMCYGNVSGAYTSQCRPPLRSTHNTQSDHNIILLGPERKNCPHAQCRGVAGDDDEDLEETYQMGRMTLS